MTHKKPRIVVLGGGTGIYPVVASLSQLSVSLSTIITVADSGGSTGRIRDEFGFPPVGDLRQSLAAQADPVSQSWISKILLYRFSKGTGLKGHNLGNLILTALQDMTGSTSEALAIARTIFHLKGHVIPVTETPVHLEITYADGSTAVGEHILDDDAPTPKAIDHVRLIPEAVLNPLVLKTLTAADLVIIGPGDYFASLQAVLVAPGMREAFQKVNAPIAYIVNLMTRHTQTHDMPASEHVQGIENCIGRKLTHIISNNDLIPHTILERYAAEFEFPVVDDLGGDTRVIRAPLLSNEIREKQAHDTAHRSLLRHDQDKLLAVLQQLL